MAISVMSPAVQSATVEDLLPDEGVLLGVYTKPKDGDWTQAGIKRRFNQVQDYSGRDLDAGHYFYNMNESFPTWREQWHSDEGRVPLVSWAAVDVKQVTNGVYDSQIIARANAVKDFGEPILLRWFWEMDGNKHGDLSGTPAQYIAAWKYIVGKFRDRNVDNAQFVWCPNADAFKRGTAAQWYPGDAWVDWMCADGYNWTPGKPNTQWRGPSDIFQPYYDWAVGHNKPMMIGETGVQERNSGEKGNWYRQWVTDLKNNMPEIDLVMFYDSDVIYDWWMDTSQSSRNGWRDMATDPYMSGQGGGGGGTTTTTTRPPTTTTTTTRPPGTTTTTRPPGTTTTTRPPGTTTTTTTPPAPDPEPEPGGGTPIAFRASASAVGNQSSYTVRVPNSVRSSDVMLLVVSANTRVAIGTPSGWSVLETKTDGSIKTKVMYRVARNSDSGDDVTVKLGKRQKATVTLVAYDGVSTSNPFLDYRVVAESGNTRTHRAPAVSTTRDDAVIVRYWADRTSSTSDWTNPNGQTRRVELVGSGGGRVTSMLTDSAANTPAGVAWVDASANAASDKATMWTIVLRASS